MVITLRILAAILLCCVGAAAVAAEWPERPIRLIVSFPPGGSADSVARPLAQKLGEILGQQVLVVNKPGANGNIGLAEVARAAPDGYTVTLNPSSFSINPHVHEKLPYDSANDFTPIALVAKSPLVLLVNRDLPVANLQEFVNLARAQPKKVIFAISGIGAAAHLATLMFNKSIGTDILMVPYKGNAQALTDLIGGQVSALFDPVQTALPQIRSGRLRALTVASDARLPEAAEIPTAAESGLRSFRFYSWYVVLGPANLPANVQSRLVAALQLANQDAALQARYVAMGLETKMLVGDALTAFLRAESDLYQGIVQEAGIPKQ
jgi:tripartite-type tricarboxylate transporter receptor subunit TctC